VTFFFKISKNTPGVANNRSDLVKEIAIIKSLFRSAGRLNTGVKMEESGDKFVVFVDTSYLMRTYGSEKGDWNRLLQHAKLCIGNLNVRPRLEIQISEIALREYRGKLIDELLAEIEGTARKINDLQEKWCNNIAVKALDWSFSRDFFPKRNDVVSKVDQSIQELLDSGIRRIDMQGHHGDAVWENYFNWGPPFGSQSISERVGKSRKRRRDHIPDAWILQVAVDAKNNGQEMLCLCDDGNLSDALKAIDHKVFKNAKDILDLLFPRPVSPPSEVSNDGEMEADDPTPLDSLLTKAPNDTVKDIFLRLLGFVVPLNTPTHASLIDAVATKGFDRKLIEACAVILSDKSRPYIKDTGSHYIVGDSEICTAAADRLTQEIIEMLE
jgi:hypothetical protein